MYPSNKTALVLFSGGQDSGTCLGWALNTFEHVLTIGFDYGQRHNIEMTCRTTVLKQISNFSMAWSQRLEHDTILTLDLFSQIGETAMTSDVAITLDKEGLPNTFVPGRNLIFLMSAAAFAWRNNIQHLVIGVCETDFSGYPDCRDNTIKAVQLAISLGLGKTITIHTPLMWLDKAQTWMLAHQIGGDPFVELIRTKTHTCYLGEHDTLRDWGYGCGTCLACEFRKNGWEIFAKNISQITQE